MGKFIFKFFIIFFSFISILFFSLISFNEHRMNRTEQPSYQSGFTVERDQMRPNYDRYDMPQRPTPPDMRSRGPQGSAAHSAPPAFIPFIFIMLLSFIFIYFVLRYIAKTFVEPLEQIKENVKKIKDGTLDVEFTTDSENKEILTTFETLNNMTEGLKQKEKLYDNFIQNIVHDLRAPVIAQERAMEILGEEFEDNPLVKGLVSNNDAFLKMINEIIEAFSQRDVKLEKTEFNLSKMVDSIIEALRPASDSKNIKTVNLVENDLTIYADYLSFNRIVANLVSNAIENIDEGKTVKVKAFKTRSDSTIIVEDNGAGIEDTEKIFKKYSSSNKSGKKAVSGLGLAIVAELVKKNDGTIRVESELGKYTKFIIELNNGKN